MDNDVAITDIDRCQALEWLRKGLMAITEVMPLPQRRKKQTSRLIRGMPDWLLAKWAETLKIDYLNWSKICPLMAEEVCNPAGEQAIKEYADKHDVVGTANHAEDLVDTVMRAQEGALAEPENIQKQIAALFWADSTPDGAEFTRHARIILGNPEKPSHVLVDYRMAFENGSLEKLEGLEQALAGGHYGGWVEERLIETKRYLGLEPPHFHVYYGERTPQWDQLWQRVFTGGDEN